MAKAALGGSDEEDQEPFSQIREKGAVPDDTPTDRTEKEKSSLERAKSLNELNPAGRHLAVNEELIERLRKECDSCKSDLSKSNAELAALKARYSAISEAMRSNSWHALLATTAITLGGVAIGSPGTIPILGVNEEFTTSAGWGVLVLGIVSLFANQAIAQLWKSPFDE